MMAHKLTAGTELTLDARQVRTRSKLRAALVALLARQELAGITVQMIVAEAGIGYATFFRHYSAIDALLLDVAEQLLARFVDGIMPAVIAQDRTLILNELTVFVRDEHRTVHALLVGGGATVRREIAARAARITENLPVDFDAGIARDLAITHAVDTISNIVAWWVSNDLAMPDVDVARLIDRLALQPLSE